jgi:hypothetical protein
MNKSGKYMIFAWQVGKHNGGMRDLIGTIDRIDQQAIEIIIKNAMKEHLIDPYVDNIVVVDKVTLNVIKHKNIPEFYELPL